MRMREHNNKNNGRYHTYKQDAQGFTLAEVLIVVAIVAILVVVSIPIFTSQLEKTRRATCLANSNILQRQIIYEEMTNGRTSNRTELLKKEIASTGASCPSGGAYSIKVSATDSESFEVVCSKHGGGANLGDDATRKAVIDAIKEFDDNNGIVDSAAASLKADSKAGLAVKKLMEAGIDLKAMGATTWQYNTAGGGSFLYWTTLDVGTLKAGTTIPVMRYNATTGTYTVWTTTVGEKKQTDISQEPYKILGGNSGTSYTGYKPSTSQNKDDQTYANMLEKYEQAMKEYEQAIKANKG